MAELENEVDVQDTDYDLDVQDTQDEKIEEEITYEQALQWREEAKREREARQKAEKSIVEKKKELAKKTSTQSPIDIKEAVKQIREEEKFFEKNPEAESYREKIEEYKSK
jgi:post-segregation antitoxin (ccd killing protein)